MDEKDRKIVVPDKKIIFDEKEKISRRDFLGLSARGAAATMVAGVFAPMAGCMVGMGGVAEAASKKVKHCMENSSNTTRRNRYYSEPGEPPPGTAAAG